MCLSLILGNSAMVRKATWASDRGRKPQELCTSVGLPHFASVLLARPNSWLASKANATSHQDPFQP